MSSIVHPGVAVNTTFPKTLKPHPPGVNDCYFAALDYLKRGWSVLPLCPEKKHPLVGWKPYQDTLATEGEVRVWWTNHPTANVGVAMGPGGVVGIDVDSEHGQQLLTEMAGEDLPATWEFSTPGGGTRLLYRLPEGAVSCPISFADPEGGEALKLLGRGSQTVMPPSVHPSGKVYTWVEGPHANETTLADAPAWLVTVFAEAWAKHQTAKVPPGQAFMLGGEWVVQRARKYLGAMEPLHPEASHSQDASTHLLKGANALVVGFALDETRAVGLLNEWAGGYYPDHELERKCRDALKHCNKERGYLLKGANGESNGSVNYSTGPAKAESVSPPKPLATKPAFTPQGITAVDLMNKEFEEIRYAVPDYLPEGASILAGRPKIGKSWMVLGVALAVASGGTFLAEVQVQKGEVLYLALEDGQRRLKKRLSRILKAQHGTVPAGFHFYTEWPRSSDGGLTLLEQWMTDHPDTRLIIIDTLARLRDKRKSNAALYEEDYEAIAHLQRLALKYQVAILIVHHTRKNEESDDPLEIVSGTQGLTGAADCILVLKRQRHESAGTLFITGRDVEEREVNLTWDAEYCLWSAAKTNDPDKGLNPNQRKARMILKVAGKPLTVAEIHPHLNMEYNSAAKMLARMAKDNWLKKDGHGQYAHPDVSNSSTCPVGLTEASAWLHHNMLAGPRRVAELVEGSAAQPFSISTLCYVFAMNLGEEYTGDDGRRWWRWPEMDLP